MGGAETTTQKPWRGAEGRGGEERVNMAYSFPDLGVKCQGLFHVGAAPLTQCPPERTVDGGRVVEWLQGWGGGYCHSMSMGSLLSFIRSQAPHPHES